MLTMVLATALLASLVTYMAATMFMLSSGSEACRASLEDVPTMVFDSLTNENGEEQSESGNGGNLLQRLFD